MPVPPHRPRPPLHPPPFPVPADTLRDLLTLLDTHGAAADAALPEALQEADLRPWRDRIDALDRSIVALLNERLVCAHVIGHIKKQLGLAVYAPRREDEVIQNVLGANGGPLPDEAVRRLFERVIDETRALERQRYAAPPDA